MKNKNTTLNFINEHNNDPIYIACKMSIDNKRVSVDVSDRIIKKIFGKISNKTEEIDLKFPIIHELNLPFSFHKEYQSKIEDMSNETILKILFTKLSELNLEGYNQNKFNVFDLFNFKLDKKTFYESFNEQDKITAHSFARFINKIKDACLDVDSIPYPYSTDRLMPTSLKYIQEINYNLLKNMKPIFTYSKVQTRDIVLKSFTDQIKYLFNQDNENISKEYYNNIKNEILDFHPKFFKLLEDNENNSGGIYMPRKIKIDYLEHKASTLDEEKFSFFANSFKSLNTDYDLIANFVSQNINMNKENKNNQELTLEKNINNLMAFYLKDDEDITSIIKNNTHQGKMKL